MGIAGENGTPSLEAENAELRRQLAELSRFRPSDPSPNGHGDRYRRIVESAVDYAIIAADLDGVITEWNDAADTIFGWSSRQMVGRPIASIFTPEDVENAIHEREMRFALTMGKAHDDRWHLKADGGRFYASGQMMPLSGEDDERIGYLKILRDRTREETGRRELEVSRERLEFALDASALVGTWDWDVAADIVYADSRFAGLYGVDPARAAEGAPFAAYAAGIHADDALRVRAEIEHALASGGTFASEYRTIDTHGVVHWVRARGRCFHDGAGRPDRLPGAIVDISTERRREAQQAALLRIGDDLLSGEGPVDYTHRALEILGGTLELDRVGYAQVDAGERFADIVSIWTRAGVAPMPGAFELSRFGSGFVERLRAGLLPVEDVASDPATRDGAAAWAEIGVVSTVNMSVVESGRLRVVLFLHSGQPRAWQDDDVAFIREVLNRAWNVSERRRAETALREAETRLLLAHEAADIGTFDYDLLGGELLWDARCRACFGMSGDEPVAYETHFLPALHPEDREATDRAVACALDPAGSGKFDCVYRTIGREDGRVRHIHATGQTVVKDNRTVRFVGAVRDITEEKQAEERQTLLARELQHRVKNTLAMVNALANQTLRRAANAQEGLAAFSARLIALSHAHDILTQTSWTSAPIGAIVAESLATHQPGGAERIRWSGPDLPLNAKQSLALALALHELATNAAKYGALSNDTGTVEIGWRVDPGADEALRLAFEWRETGGPEVTAPASRGFGSRLIEQSLALEFGGSVAARYLPGGVVCTINAPMREDESGDAED